MVGAKTQVLVLEVVQASSKKTGSDHQQQTESRLRRHQRLEKTRLPAAARSASSLILECRSDPRVRGLKRRSHAENDTGHGGDRHRKPERPKIWSAGERKLQAGLDRKSTR